MGGGAKQPRTKHNSIKPDMAFFCLFLLFLLAKPSMDGMMPRMQSRATALASATVLLGFRDTLFADSLTQGARAARMLGHLAARMYAACYIYADLYAAVRVYY